MEMSSPSFSTGKRGALLLKALLIPLLGFPLWLALSNAYSIVFALHSDSLDAIYLLLQIGAVYAAMLYLAWLVTALVIGSANITWRDLGFVACRVNGWGVLWFVLSLVYLLIFNVVWQLVCNYWHISLLNRSGLLTSYAHMPYSQMAMVVIIGIVGPLGEELLFRGLLFRMLDKLLTRYLVRGLSSSLASTLALMGAASISAGVFAGLHPDMASFPIYFVIGVVLALWVRYTRSIWPGWIVHIAFNSLFIIRLLM